MNSLESPDIHLHEEDLTFERLAASIEQECLSRTPKAAKDSCKKEYQGLKEYHSPKYTWSGSLKKKSNWLPTWERCKVMLDGTKLLYYNFKDRTDKELHKFSILSYKKHEEGRLYSFSVKNEQEEILYFACDSSVERLIWTQTIAAALQQPQDNSLADLNIFQDEEKSNSVSIYVNLDVFYHNFGSVWMQIGNFATITPFLHPSLKITTNYPSIMPIHGEYHGYDGFVEFLTNLYSNIGISHFLTSQIARENDLAVVQGRETIRNMQNTRRYRETWTHEIRFASDGRIAHLNIKGDPVAAAIAFGSNHNESSTPISLPQNIEKTSTTCPPGTLFITCIGAEKLRDVQLVGRMTPYVRFSLHSFSFTRTKKGKHKADDDTKKTLKSRCRDGNVFWTEHLSMSFCGSVPGTTACLYVEVRNSSLVRDELVGATKINLAPFLICSSGDTGDQALGAIPQWYPLFRQDQFTASHNSLECNSSLLSDSSIRSSTESEASSCSSPKDEKIKQIIPHYGQLHLGISFKEDVAEIIKPHSNSIESEEIQKKIQLPRSRRSFDCLEDLHKLITKSPKDGENEKQLENMNNDSKEYTEMHSFSVSSTIFHIPCRYQLIKPIGQGAYGVVIAASDKETGASVAIKNIRKTFDDLIDAKRIVREIRLMRHLDHPNILNVRDVMRPPSLAAFEDTYIVTDLMETDLHHVIHSKQELTQDHISYIAYQILCALQYMHSANVIHRDMKPSNILINSDCFVKICDFGLARGVDTVIGELTEYVVTRWYRAPELLLSSNYETKIDVWSVGCILAELYTREVLFPGRDHVHQLQLIIDFLGSPLEEELGFITNRKAKNWILRQEPRVGKPLEEKFPKISEEGIHLLKQLLSFDPKQRITVTDALKHRYFDKYRDPQYEKLAVVPFNFDFERRELDKSELRRLIFREVCDFHPEAVEELQNTSNTLSERI